MIAQLCYLSIWTLRQRDYKFKDSPCHKRRLSPQGEKQHQFLEPGWSLGMDRKALTTPTELDCVLMISPLS